MKDLISKELFSYLDSFMFLIWESNEHADKLQIKITALEIRDGVENAGTSDIK